MKGSKIHCIWAISSPADYDDYSIVTWYIIWTKDRSMAHDNATSKALQVRCNA